MSQVYVVTSGEYSDYSIRGVFSDASKAQAWADWINGPERKDYCVEEWPLDEEVVRPTGAFTHRVWCSSQRPAQVWAEWDYKASIQPPKVQVQAFDTLFVMGFGETPEHAARSVREQLRAIKAGTYIVEGLDTSVLIWPESV